MDSTGGIPTTRLWGCGTGESEGYPVAASPHYQGCAMSIDYGNYPTNWLTEIRPAILRRAGSEHGTGTGARCEWCNVLNYTRREKQDPEQNGTAYIVITIAHLDQDTNNNDPENLAALCQRCHLRHDRPHHLINASLTRDRKKKQLLLTFVTAQELRKQMSTKGPNHSFNVLLSPHHMKLLEEIAFLTATNKSIVIRQAVTAYHAMKVNHTPTCADGQACRVPNMFVQPAAAAPMVAP